MARPSCLRSCDLAQCDDVHSYDKLRGMATKPQPVPWGELNDLRYDLFEWLVEQRLAKPKENPLRVVFRLQGNAAGLGKLTATVVEALLDVELFDGARIRANRDNKRLKELPDDHRDLFFDDRVERETDGAIRALLPSIRHIERLVGKTSTRRATRRRAMRLPAKDASTEDLETVLLHLTELITRQVQLLLRVFLELHPSIPPEEITLTGFRRLERRVRKRLLDAGFTAEKRSRLA